jgi:predicted neutral ceramidase superfamily lipid hydrolase
MINWERATDLVPGDLVWMVFHSGGSRSPNVVQSAEINVIVEVISVHHDHVEVVNHSDNSVIMAHPFQLFLKRI